ncbi:hypothetical protein, partial [Streptomyces sp. NPDC059489]|uniref:hypothetical protein n=1 Tax=Streptomyces sp. NPDC059489 TaxID=3346849 RepID=UPI0036C35221
AYQQRDTDGGVLDAAVAALDGALAGIQNGPYSPYDRRAALNLRAALVYYVREGHVNAPQRTPRLRVDDIEVNLGRWLLDFRRYHPAAGRVWVRRVLDVLGMRWGRLRPPAGDDAGPASSEGRAAASIGENNQINLSSARVNVRPAPARAVRNPQPSEHDLKHPEWDLTDGEWNLIKNPLEEIARKDARNSFNALMFRFRNGNRLRGEIPRDRYGNPSTGVHAFYQWARADALLEALKIVEENPGVVHPVVERTLRAAFDAAQDYMNRRGLVSIPPVIPGNVQSESQENADGNGAS